MSLNSVNVMGNLTRDPELKYTQSVKSFCTLSIANNRIYTRNGEKVSEVSYFDVEVWGVIAENCSKYLSKGSGIIVEGRLKQDRWEKEGKTQSKVRIAANNIHFLAKKRDDSSSDQQVAAGTGTSPSSSSDGSVAWDE